MLLTRFWMILLAATTVGALAIGHLSRSFITRELTEGVKTSLKQDRHIIEAALRHEARIRLDEVSPLSTDRSIQLNLRNAGLRPVQRLSPYSERLEERLKHTNLKLRDLQADILLALDKRGVVVAAIGSENIRPGHSFYHFPLVRAVLSGRVRDDVWMFDAKPYRLAARPVVFGGNYVGAIIHAKSFDRGFTQRLAKMIPGATLAFYHHDKVIASHEPVNYPKATPLSSIEANIAEALASAEYTRDMRSKPLSISAADAAVYSPFNDPKSSTPVGYAVARPKYNVHSVFALINSASREDIRSVPVFGLILLALLLVGIGMALMWLERDRIIRRLQDAVRGIGREGNDQLDLTQFSGSYRHLGHDINHALQNTAANPTQAQRPITSLDSILGSQHAPAGSFFGFKEEPSASSPDQVGSNEAETHKPKRMPPPPPPRSPLSPSPGEKSNGTRDPNSEIPTVHVPAGKIPAAMLSGAEPLPTDEDLTVISEISQNFGDFDSPASTRNEAKPSPDRKKPSKTSPTRESEYPRLYKEFIELKRKCDEPTAGLTYDRFLIAVKRNREEIMRRHKAQSVHFNVYEKDGKAALKAKPVKH